MNDINPLDINRIENFLGIKIREIEQLSTDNYLVRVYNVNKQEIVTIDNYTNECYRLMA